MKSGAGENGTGFFPPVRSQATNGYLKFGAGTNLMGPSVIFPFADQLCFPKLTFICYFKPQVTVPMGFIQLPLGMKPGAKYFGVISLSVSDFTTTCRLQE